MQYDWESIAIVSGIGVVVMGLGAWFHSKAERRLRRWAEENGLTILEKHQARFSCGPFTWTAARTDYVYRLTVEDSTGDILEGWARVVGLTLVFARGTIEAKWDNKTHISAGHFD